MDTKKYKVGIAWGCWDGLTSAHIEILKQAKDKCDYLIVGVSDDQYIRTHKWKNPILDFGTRMMIVSKLCDRVIPQSSYFTKEMAVKHFRPDVIFVGDEYENKEWDGKKLGVNIEYIKHNNLIHSSDIKI